MGLLDKNSPSSGKGLLAGAHELKVKRDIETELTRFEKFAVDRLEKYLESSSADNKIDSILEIAYDISRKATEQDDDSYAANVMIALHGPKGLWVDYSHTNPSWEFARDFAILSSGQPPEDVIDELESVTQRRRTKLRKSTRTRNPELLIITEEIVAQSKKLGMPQTVSKIKQFAVKNFTPDDSLNFELGMNDYVFYIDEDEVNFCRTDLPFDHLRLRTWERYISNCLKKYVENK